MAKLTRKAFQALLLHDDRFSLDNLSTTYSSYNEGEPEPGEPQPSVKGWMDVEATGTASVGDDYDLETLYSGRPVGGEGGATYRWRKEGEAATSWRGFLAHNKVSGFQWVAKGNFTHPYGVALPDGTVVAAIGGKTTSTVYAYSRTAAGVWSQATITTDASATTYPTLVRLPDNADSANSGRLICVFGRDDLSEGGTNYLTLSTHYSDDDGATWTQVVAHASGLHADATNLTIVGCAATWHNGYLTVVLDAVDTSTGPDTTYLYHLVSVDNGASFELIETISSNATWRRNPSLFTAPGGAVGMVYWYDSSPGTGGLGATVRWAKKEAPLSTFAGSATYDTEFTPGMVPDDNTDERPVVAGVDAEGFLWVMFRRGSGERYIYAHRFDPADMSAAPDRWLRYDPGSGSQTWRHPIDTGDAGAGVYLTGMNLVPGPDGLLLLSGSLPAGGSFEVRLGGYHSRDWQVQTFGRRGNTPADDNVGNCYLGFALPSTISIWTAAGAGTEAISSTGLDLTTAANVINYQRDGIAGTPCLVMFTINVTSGGSLSSNDVAVLLRRADNSVHYEAILRLTTTSARVYDVNAAATVGSDATGLSTGARDWLFSIEGNRVSTWYKPPYTSVWTQGPEGTLTDGGAGTTPNRVQWGHLASAAAGSSWRWFGSCIDNENADPGLTTQTAADLQGRAWSQNPLYLDNGWRIAGRGGPTYKGDTWDAAAASRYPVANVHMDVSPSPTVQWRSSDTTEQILAWELTGTNPTYLLNSSIGCALLRPNFRTAYFEGRTAGGAWVTLITFDTAIEYEGTGGAMTYTVAGDHVYPAAGTNAGARAFAMDELRDGYAILESTGEGGGDDAVKILHNSAGVWRPGTAGRPLDLLVAPVPTVGATPTNIRIIPPAVVGVVHEITNAHHVAFRLRIPASQATVGGFYHLGGIIAGPLAFFAPEAGNARIFRSEGNARVSQDAAGRRRVRQMGDPRRVVEFSWVDPVWTGQLYESNADPDYVVARNAGAYEGIALTNDARLLEGALRRTDAGALPCVWIEQVDPANVTTDQFIYVDPANFVPGRLFGPVTRQNVVGNNLDGGTYALNRVAIEEIK